MLDSKNKIQKHFDGLTKPYSFNSNRFWSFFRNREKNTFIYLTKNLNKDDCLDLGAGSGEYSKILLKMGSKKAVCLDFSSEPLSLANEPKIEKIISDVEIFKTSGRYDLILCLGVLEFLHKPEKFLLDLKKNLKPQGKLIILLPLSPIKAFIYSFIYILKGIRINTLNLKQMNAFLTKNGFVLEKTKSAGNFFSGFSVYSILII